MEKPTLRHSGSFIGGFSTTLAPEGLGNLWCIIDGDIVGKDGVVESNRLGRMSPRRPAVSALVG